jgi:hypothetical protein
LLFAIDPPLIIFPPRSDGRVAERSNVPDSKSGDRAIGPWVRIPPLPRHSRRFLSLIPFRCFGITAGILPLKIWSLTVYCRDSPVEPARDRINCDNHYHARQGMPCPMVVTFPFVCRPMPSVFVPAGNRQFDSAPSHNHLSSRELPHRNRRKLRLVIKSYKTRPVRLRIGSRSGFAG